MKKYQMTIIVPIFNEKENMVYLYDNLSKYLNESKIASKVLFIDDGSTDESLEDIIEICNKDDNFNYISFVINSGLSTAIKAGIDHTETELIGYIDADLQTTPYDFEKLIKYIPEYDVVVGFRVKRNDSWNKRIQSIIANAVRRKLINDGIIDTGCPLKILKTDFAKKLIFFDGLHRFIPAMTILQGGKVKQVPVRHFSRINGTSKFNIFNRSLKPLQDVFAYRWMKSRYIKYKIKSSNIK